MVRLSSLAPRSNEKTKVKFRGRNDSEIDDRNNKPNKTVKS